MSKNTRKVSASGEDAELNKQFALVMKELVDAQAKLPLEPGDQREAVKRLTEAAGLAPGGKATIAPTLGGKRKHKTYRKKRNLSK